MKRKLLATLLAAVAAVFGVFSLSACDDGNENENNNPPVNSGSNENDDDTNIGNNDETNGNTNNGEDNKPNTPTHTHSYTESVIDPTCTTNGYTLHTCTCGESYKDSYVNAFNHNYVDNVCSRCEAKPTEGLEYLESDFVCTVIGIGTATDSEINIPAEHNGLPVTEIVGNFGPFRGCKNITSVTIPDSVQEIGYGAFLECSNLTNVTIGNGVRDIRESAFRDTNLTSVFIPDNVYCIERYVFYNCENLTNITLGKHIEYIGEDAFFCCTGLESISVTNDNTKYHSTDNCLIETESKTLLLGCKNSLIPSNGNVTKIGKSAFYGCSGLSSIIIPDSVTEIGEWAFIWSGLTSIIIGNSVSEIGNYAIACCPELESITVNEDNNVYHSNNNCLIETESKTLILGCKNSVIPTDGSVTIIGNGAFNCCYNLTSIIIPDCVTVIGDGAFAECCFTNITIPNSVTEIGSYAFEYCETLTNVTIPNSVTMIKNAAFSDCTTLISINFNGTISQWNAIEKLGDWKRATGDFTIHCTDGKLDKDGNEIE